MCPVYFPAVLFMLYGMLLAVFWKCRNHFQSVPSDLGSLLSFLLSAVWDLLWLACWVCGQTVQHTGLSQYDGTVPPGSPHPGTLPEPADSTASCAYSEDIFVLITLRRGHWGVPRNPHRHRAFWLWRCYSNNSECYKHYFFKHLLKIFCIPSGEIHTQRSCECNKKGRCFRQTPSSTETMVRTLMPHDSLMNWFTCQFIILTKIYQKIANNLIIGSVGTRKAQSMHLKWQTDACNLSLIQLLVSLVLFLPYCSTAIDKIMRLWSRGRPNERENSYKWNDWELLTDYTKITDVETASILMMILIYYITMPHPGTLNPTKQSRSWFILRVSSLTHMHLRHSENWGKWSFSVGVQQNCKLPLSPLRYSTGLGHVGPDGCNRMWREIRPK